MGRDSEDGIEGIEGIGDKIASTRTPAERNCPPPILSASAFIGLSISSAFIGPALVEGVAVSLRRSPCL